MRRNSLVAALLALPVAACVTPQLPDNGGDDEPPPDATPIDAPPPDAPVGCELPVQNVGTGHHNPGQNCLDCHRGQDPLAPIFTMGGTAYVDKEGTLPTPGTVVVVVDGNGLTVKMPVQQNGNFWTTAQLSPPYTTYITECPDSIPMVTTFVDGDCNACHEGTEEPGRVYFDP